MAIRTRITDSGKRENINRANTKLRHPLLRTGTRHQGVWQAIVQEGNPRGGMTAAQIKNATHLFHPQILKDLIDHRLVAKRHRNNQNQFLYVADERGRGTYMQEVTVEVELLEDEHGRFVTKTTLIGNTGEHSRIIRSLGKRRVKFNIPLPNEEGVMPVTGVVNVDNADGFSRSRGGGTTKTIDAQAEQVEDPLLLEVSASIIEG